MTKKTAKLRNLLIARVGQPDENLSKIARESDVSYHALYSFYKRGRALDFDSFDKLHKYLTGQELKLA